MAKPVDVPKEWLPFHHWIGWHYKQQVEFIEAQEKRWEVVFLAGNGTGKTHMLYYTGLLYLFGLHPYQFAEPPLAAKVLVGDFEHGFGKIFIETAMKKVWLPPRWNISEELPNGKLRLLKFVCEKDRADEWMHDNWKDDDPDFKGFVLDEHPATYIEPMLHTNMVEKLPSRDDRTLKIKNGSFMFFQTGEQKKKLHSGTNFDILLCDEEPPYQIYDESVRGMRTAKGGGKILHAFTPPFDEEGKQQGPTWSKDRLIDPIDEGKNPDGYVVRASMNDNPAITNAFMERFFRNKTEEQIRIQKHGEYPTFGILCFPEYTDRQWKDGHLLPYDFEVPWNHPDFLFEMAIDWHGSKPCAVIWSFELLSGVWKGLEKGDVVVFGELDPETTRNMTISEVKIAIREFEGWRTVRIRRYGDPKMKDVRNDLKSGFNPWNAFAHKGQEGVSLRLSEAWNRDPYVSYSVIRDFLRGRGKQNKEHPRLFVREDCRTLRHCMKNHYNVKHRDGTSNPDPKYSDYPVVLKYIMQGKARKLKKNMDFTNRNKWGLVTYSGDPAFGPYMGHYVNRESRYADYLAR